MDTTLLEQDSFARLASLDALGAVRAWLDDDYDYGEPGKWGEPYEMIDEVEGDDDGDDDEG